MRQDSPTLDEVRARLDCRQLAEGYGVRFRNRSSEWWLAHCFNAQAHARGDRNPSLSIGPQGYKCFSANCAISGDVFTLLAHFEQLDVRAQFDQVFALAAERAGVDLVASARAPTRAEHIQGRQRRAWRQKRARRQKRRVCAHPTGPPVIAELFPDMHQAPVHMDPRHERLEIMRGIWELVRPLELGAQACQWLEGRGIRPEIAHAYGCRDWSAAASDILELLSTYEPASLAAAGFERVQEDGRIKRWCGVRDLRGEAWARGLGVPVVHPGWPLAPLAWRWRLYEPIDLKSGSRLKVLAQYSGAPRVPSLPLGLAPPSGESLLEVARWPSICQDLDSPRYAVVVSEGEPDWLSVADVAASLSTDLYVVSVGLVAMSHGYPVAHSSLLEGAERVVCLMDQGHMMKKWGKTGGQLVVEKIRAMLLYEGQRRGDDFDSVFEKVDNQLLERLQPDDSDVNDLHQRGLLAGVLQEALGEIL